MVFFLIVVTSGSSAADSGLSWMIFLVVTMVSSGAGAGAAGLVTVVAFSGVTVRGCFGGQAKADQ